MRILFVAVTLSALAFRAAETARRSLQVDEGLTLYLGGLKVGDALFFLRQHDVHPPLLTLAVHGLLALHTPDWLIRALFVLVGTACVVLVMAIVRVWSTGRAALIAGLFAACMPLLFFNDSMVRMYTPFDALALLSFYLLSILATRDDLPASSRRALWVGWTICAAAMLYTLYAAFFVIAAQLGFALFVRREFLWKMLAGAAGAAVAWLPQLPTFLAQLPVGGVAYPSFAGHEAQLLATLPEQASLQIPYGGVMGATLVVVVWLWAISAFVAVARARPNSGDRAPTLLLWIAAPALLTLIYSIASHKLLYTDRYYTLFAYALCCWTGVALDRVKSIVPALAACLIIAGIGFQHVTDPKHATADWGAIGGLLRQQSRAHDLFIFEQGSPIFVLGRSDVLAGHPILYVFTNGQPARVLDAAKRFNRVWYVGFQSWPVDRTQVLLRGLEHRYRLVRYRRFDDALESEAVLVAQFEKAGARQGL